MENSDPRQLLVVIANILQRLGIPYLVTGGIAVLVWGRPRFTADIDIVIELGQTSADQLAEALQALGATGYLDREDMRRAMIPGVRLNEFNFIDGNTGVKVDFWTLQSNFDRQRLTRRVAREILGQPIYFSSPEDLILSKLLWHQQSSSSRQWEDVQSIIRISGATLDWDYLQKTAAKLGVKEELAKAKQEIK
ncbi:MAG: nucleotidyltransferase family protein [Candidatus Magasanikbacteria bacterium]|nr:nucleotidyltransferase family protein [Candidatus Magasanikbacteria bacterium]